MEFEKLLKELGEQRAALTVKITNAATNEELDQIELDLRKVDMQIENIQAQILAQNSPGEDPAARSDGEGGENKRFSPIASYRNSNQQGNTEEDMYATMEYRNAFKDYIVSGTPIPEKFRNEQRTAEMTVVGDVAAVIPTTIQNKVIEDLTVEGKLLSRITQTSLQGGIQIPISEINPTATWLSSEASVSEEQKAKMEAKLQFAYHVLEARIAIGLLSATVSLPIFEATVVKQLKKAMIRAIESAIVNGTGSGQPLGITGYELPDKQKIAFNDKNIGTVKGWARAEAAIPEAYEEGEVYLMNKQTWEMHLNSMVDANGQKIGLGKINEKGQKILNGREVLTVDKLPGYDAATPGQTFAILVNLEEYLLNSNLAMYYKKYYDEDKNKWVHKALMIADGKMSIGKVKKDEKEELVGAKGLIYLQKESTKSE